jgi:hypothetical protein
MPHRREELAYRETFVQETYPLPYNILEQSLTEKHTEVNLP